MPPFKTMWPKFMTQFHYLQNPDGSRWVIIFFFFLLLTPCSWADLHLNVFVILKNLLNGFVQKNPFGFSSRGVAECQALSAKYNICAVSSASSVAGYYCFSMAGCFYLLKQNNQE